MHDYELIDDPICDLEEWKENPMDCPAFYDCMEYVDT